MLCKKSSLLIDDEISKDSEVIADVFSIFLLTITENPGLHQEVRGDAISLLKEAYPIKILGVKIIPTTETEIKSEIQSLKAKNSSDHD
jgi:hypothetical protein